MFAELALIALLGHDDFRTREAATAALRRIEPIDRLRAVRSDDPEVTWRVRGLLSDWRATFRPTRHPLTPWLDQLPEDYPDRAAVYEHYRPQYEYSWSFPWWGEWRWSTERLVDDLIARGDSRESIVALLDRMAAKESDFIRRFGPGHPLEPLLRGQLPKVEVYETDR